MKTATGFNDNASMVWLMDNASAPRSVMPASIVKDVALKVTSVQVNPATDIISSVDSLLETAKLALKQNRWSDVVSACDRLMENPRTILAAQRMRARALGSLGNLEEALAAWHKVCALAPAAPDGHLNVARLERRSGNWPEALDAARRVVALEPAHAEALSLAGQAFVKHRKAVDGKVIWAGLATANADQLRDFQAHLESAERWNDAADALKALLDCNPGNIMIQQERTRFTEEVLERGKAQENWQDFVSAASAYRAASVVDPGNADAARLLSKMTRPLVAAGREKLKERDYAAAGQFFSECLTYSPAEPVAQVGMARVYDALQQWTQAEEAWSNITAREPANGAAWLRLGIASGRNQNFEKGMAAFRKVADPELATSATENMGKLAHAAFKAARVHFLSSENIKASQVLGIAEQHIGNDEPVRQLREKISRGLRTMQQEAQEARDMERVALLGRHIVIGRKTDISAWTVYARALFAQKHMPECLTAWHAVEQLDPLRVEAKIGLARAHFALGQHEACIAAAKSAQALDPGEPKAAEILAKAQQGQLTAQTRATV